MINDLKEIIPIIDEVSYNLARLSLRLEDLVKKFGESDADVKKANTMVYANEPGKNFSISSSGAPEMTHNEESIREEEIPVEAENLKANVVYKKKFPSDQWIDFSKITPDESRKNQFDYWRVTFNKAQVAYWNKHGKVRFQKTAVLNEYIPKILADSSYARKCIQENNKILAMCNAK